MTPSVLRSAFFDSTPFSKQTAGSCTGATASGNAQVMGTVKAGGTVVMSGNAKITGSVTAAGVTKTGNAQVVGTVTTSTAAVDCSPVDLASLTSELQGSNDNGKIPPSFLANGVLKLKGNDQLTLPVGKYLLDGLDISGNGKLMSSGAAKVLVKGAVTVTGNGSMTTGNPQDLMVFTSSTVGASVAGSGQVKGILYAPAGPVKASGTGKVTGSVFGKGLDLSGSARVEHP